jgi:hypothetical protein
LLGLLRDYERRQEHSRDDQSFQHGDCSQGCNRVRQAARSIQAGAALAPGVTQAFKHAADIRVADVISALATPMSKIPVGGASFGD